MVTVNLRSNQSLTTSSSDNIILGTGMYIVVCGNSDVVNLD